MYGAQTWHLNEEVVEKAKRWEFSWLRKVLKLTKRAPNEGWMSYNIRTGNRIWQWAEKNEVSLIQQRLVQLHVSGLETERYEIRGGASPLIRTRMYRDTEWWYRRKDMPAYLRKRQRETLASAGPAVPSWDQLLFEVYGERDGWADAPGARAGGPRRGGPLRGSDLSPGAGAGAAA